MDPDIWVQDPRVQDPRVINMLFSVRSQSHQDCSQACIYEDQCLEIQMCVLLTETKTNYQQTLKSNIITC